LYKFFSSRRPACCERKPYTSSASEKVLAGLFTDKRDFVVDDHSSGPIVANQLKRHYLGFAGNK
jgi:hypothetical protein